MASVQLAFIRNPKTGSMSIARSLLDTDRCHRVYFHGHSPAPLPVEADVVAAFVRNPWDRAVSLYHHYRRGRASEAGMLRWYFDDHTVDPNLQVTHIGALQQSRWVTDACTFVGRFERLAEDFQALCRAAKIGSTAVLEHFDHGGAADRNARTPWTADLLDRFRPHLQPDAERFGYEEPCP